MRDQIASREANFRGFLERIERDDVPKDVQGELFRFGAILLCGHVEQCVKIIVMDRLSHRAQPRVLNFIRSYFGYGSNLDCSAIISLLDRFEPAWGTKFQKWVDQNEDVKEGIASAYGVRNPLAHGSSASLGGARLRELFLASQRLVEAVVDSTSEHVRRRR